MKSQQISVNWHRYGSIPSALEYAEQSAKTYQGLDRRTDRSYVRKQVTNPDKHQLRWQKNVSLK